MNYELWANVVRIQGFGWLSVLEERQQNSSGVKSPEMFCSLGVEIFQRSGTSWRTSQVVSRSLSALTSFLKSYEAIAFADTGQVLEVFRSGS